MVFWVSLSKFTTPENSRLLFSLWTTSKAIISINSALEKKKERKLATCDYTDGPERHYAKWDNYHRRTSTAWFQLYEIYKIVIETESIIVVARDWLEEKMRFLFNRYKILVRQYG